MRILTWRRIGVWLKRKDRCRRTALDIIHQLQSETMASNSNHPTGGRRRKIKAPPAPHLLPALPPMAGLGSLHTLSDELDEEKGVEQEAKRPRSTSTTPRSESAKAREPNEYDRPLGSGSVGPSSDEGDELGLTDGEDSDPHRSLEGYLPRLDLNSGVGASSRGCGSAGLLEALQSRQVAPLDIPAACASQGPIEFLRNEQRPQHICRPRPGA